MQRDPAGDVRAGPSLQVSVPQKRARWKRERAEGRPPPPHTCQCDPQQGKEQRRGREKSVPLPHTLGAPRRLRLDRRPGNAEPSSAAGFFPPLPNTAINQRAHRHPPCFGFPHPLSSASGHGARAFFPSCALRGWDSAALPAARCLRLGRRRRQRRGGRGAT